MKFKVQSLKLNVFTLDLNPWTPNNLNKKMALSYILLGTNLGDKAANLAAALETIRSTCGKIVQHSSVYETAAWGVTDQPVFLNCVIEVATELGPEALLGTLLEIEKQMGRVRLQRWGERVIDLDVLYYDQLVLSSETLILPHPRLQERRFTLVPLCEIAAELVHPLLHKTSVQLLESCTDESLVTKVSISL